ncbi:MAG: type IV pilus biogenesis/stability protein PilW [Zoogloeaceae bacterium]|jgi:type IV pilus assembly protein PilF|nr:type IV pilus biogenesis/stability protein PilW [Zoogloeaceae bacterium]
MMTRRHAAQWLFILACLWAHWPAGAQVVIPESSVTPQTDAGARARMHTELASLYFQEGVPSVALEEAGIAINVDPSYALAYSVRALVYASLRDFNSADADFRKALSLAPGDPEISNNYGWYLCEQRNRPQEAMAHFLNAIRNPLYGTPDIAYTNAGSCAMKAGDLVSARDYLTTAVRTGRGGALSAQLQLAKLAYQEGNMQEARNRLGEIIQRANTLPPDALWLGVRIEHKLGNRAEETSLVAQLRRLYPNSLEYQEFLKGNYD